MDARENFFRAVRRQDPESVPFALKLCPSQVEEFRRRTGSDDSLAYYGVPVRYVALNPTRHPADYTPYYRDLPPGTVVDEYGVARVPGSVEHFTRMLHPMEDFTEVAQVEAFPLPDVLADYRWEGLAERIARIRADGLVSAYHAVQVFEPAWYLRGMDGLLVDMIQNEPIAAACLDRLTDLKERQVARLAAAGVELIVFGDDVGSQQSMILGPDLWRRWLKPSLARLIRAAKAEKPDLIAFYHSDGWIEPILEDLVEIGVDVLNPVQPESMDPVSIKERFGDRLSFWGTIGTQTTMPFGTPDEVRREVARMIATVGRGGGLVLAPTHVIEPEVPWENLVALHEAVRDFGRYAPRAPEADARPKQR